MSINIPGLGFAQPNESLPPMATDHTENPTTTTATSEQATTQQPETTSEAPAETAFDSNNETKEEDVTMGEPRPAENAQPTEQGASNTEHESMEVESQNETTESSAPAVATEEAAAPSDQPAGEAASNQNSMDVEKPSEAAQNDAASAAVAEAEAAPSDQSAGEAAGNHDSMDVEKPIEAAQNDAAPATTTTENTTQNAGSTNDAPTNADSMKVDEAPNNASITDELEAFLGGLVPTDAPKTDAPTAQADGEEQQQANEHPEWEIDSSPYESSSDSSSDTTSSADSDDAAFNALNLREAARMLMDAEGGSDDEGGANQAAARAQVRTKNEAPEEVLPKPDVALTPDTKIEELGVVEHIVDSTIVVKAVTPGEHQVIDTGSPLCTAERVVIGALADVLGKVQQPLYTVRFGSGAEIAELGLEVGTRVFYPPEHAISVFTQALKSMKGSDASNLHDEEVAEDEAEFSDDEKEAEHKRMLKQKRRERAGRGGAAKGAGPHPLRNEVRAGEGGALNYDEEDGPYKPLARPPGFGAAGFAEAAEEPLPGSHRGRGRGGPRGRAQQRGRGRGRGGAPAPAGREGYSLPPQGQQYPPQQQYQPQYQQQPQYPQAPQQFQPPPPMGAPGAAQQPGFNFAMPQAFAQMFAQAQGQAQGGQGWGQQAPPPPQPPSAWGGQQGGQGAQGGVGGMLTPQVLSILSQYQAQMAQNQGQGQGQGQNQGQGQGGGSWGQGGHQGYGGQ